MIRHAACLGALVALPLAGQAPVRLTLDEAIARGRSQGVVAAVARTTAAVADRRIAQRRADLLPSVTVGGSWSRRTLNLERRKAQGRTCGMRTHRLPERGGLVDAL